MREVPRARVGEDQEWQKPKQMKPAQENRNEEVRNREEQEETHRIGNYHDCSSLRVSNSDTSPNQ
jgi:hypothetical protein